MGSGVVSEANISSESSENVLGMAMSGSGMAAECEALHELLMARDGEDDIADLWKRFRRIAATISPNNMSSLITLRT